MLSQTDYTSWETKDLIARITSLESQLRAHTAANSSTLPSNVSISNDSKRPRKLKPFDPSKYTTRLIALKFAYLGASYQGFEHHVGNSTPLPTIEEELWKALVICRLIFPPSLQKCGLLDGNIGERLEQIKGEGNGVPVDWEGVEYSKCGRTDRGVSAFGQVIGLRVRSARLAVPAKDEAHDALDNEASEEEGALNGKTTTPENQKPFDPIADELPYIALLNRVLPPTIRILAWCPAPPPNFSARFSCKERLYKYFFTNPAYFPCPSPQAVAKGTTLSKPPEGYLDIGAMQKAANYLVGTHDFRNLCKVDATKQITNFDRRITHASVERISTSSAPSNLSYVGQDVPLSQNDGQGGPTAYAFTVRGSAFLWHQVRCMVAVLFLVGQGLETPEIVQQLLDVEKNPRRPQYEMASDKPLVLWECTFSASAQERYLDSNGDLANDEEEMSLPAKFWDRGLGGDELEWIYADGESKWGHVGLMEELWHGWRTAKMDEVLAGQLLDLVASQGGGATVCTSKKGSSRSTRLFQGEDAAKPIGTYVPVMQKELMETVDVINARFLQKKARKGYRLPARTGFSPAVTTEETVTP